MIDRLRAASNEVRAQLADGRSTNRTLEQGLAAIQAMAIIDQTLDGIPDPKAEKAEPKTPKTAKPEKPAVPEKKPVNGKIPRA